MVAALLIFHEGSVTIICASEVTSQPVPTIPVHVIIPVVSAVFGVHCIHAIAIEAPSSTQLKLVVTVSPNRAVAGEVFTLGVSGFLLSIATLRLSISSVSRVTLFPALSVTVISKLAEGFSRVPETNFTAVLFACVVLPQMLVASQVIVSPSARVSVACIFIESAERPSPFTAAISSALLSGEIVSPDVINTGTSLSTLEFVVSNTGHVLAHALLAVTLGLRLFASIVPAL